MLKRAQESLNMVLALILYCRWKLLRSNQPKDESLKWLQGYLEVPYIQDFIQKTEAFQDTLFMLRKLVFKAAIICEGAKYCFHYAVKARNHELNVLDDWDDQDSDENQ